MTIDLTKVRTAAGASDTIASTDVDGVVLYTSGSAVAVTLPTGLQAGFQVRLQQQGAGQVTITPASGASFDDRASYGSAPAIVAEGGVVTLTMVDDTTGAEVWQIEGDLDITGPDDQNLVFGYGGLLLTGGSTAQTDIATSVVAVEEWTADIDGAQCTPAFATDDITLDQAGDWLVRYSIRFTGTASTVFTTSVVCTGDGTVEGGHDSTPDADTTAVTLQGHAIVSGCSVDDVITLGIVADGASKSITVTEGILSVQRLG